MYTFFSKQLVAANLNQAPALQVSTCHPVALFCFLFQRLHVSTATLWRKPLPQPSTTSLSLTPASEHTWLDLEILRMHEGTCRHLERAVVSHPHYSKMFHNVQCPLQIFDMTPTDVVCQADAQNSMPLPRQSEERWPISIQWSRVLHDIHVGVVVTTTTLPEKVKCKKSSSMYRSIHR